MYKHLIFFDVMVTFKSLFPSIQYFILFHRGKRISLRTPFSNLIMYGFFF